MIPCRSTEDKIDIDYKLDISLLVLFLLLIKQKNRNYINYISTLHRIYCYSKYNIPPIKFLCAFEVKTELLWS